MRVRISLIFFSLFFLFCGVLGSDEPLSGGVIHFQGMLTNEKGVPVGADAPEKLYMRFSVTSEDGGFTPWISNVRQVVVEDGYFAVRLGRFFSNEEPLDESVFSGNDGEGKKRYLHVEICTSAVQANCANYSPNTYKGLYRYDSEQTGNDPGLPQTQVPVPGVPFVVSAVRVVGSDTKEGPLRLSKDPDNPDVIQDLTIQATGTYNGLKIVQNQNLGLVIRQSDPSTPTPALETEGSGIIKGSVYIKGTEANVVIGGSLKSVYDEDLNDPLRGNLTVTETQGNAVQAGPIRSPYYKNPSSENYQVNVTGLTRLHRLRIVDAARESLGDNQVQYAQEVEINAKGLNVVQFDSDSDLILDPQSSLEIYGSISRKIQMESQSPGIEALGFYDNEQVSSNPTFPYQAIPHGTSAFNTLQLGSSPRLTFLRLRGLTGIFNEGASDYGDFKPLESAYIDPITGNQLHKHDLRVGADAASMIEKLNEQGKTRIIKRRMDPELAYLFENNDGLSPGRPFFTNVNWFDFNTDPSSNPLINPSLFTDHRLVVRSDLEGHGIFFGGRIESGSRKIIFGSNYDALMDFHFLNCSATGEGSCPQVLDLLEPTYLNLNAGRLSLDRSLVLTSPTVGYSLQVLGEMVLENTLISGGNNFSGLFVPSQPPELLGLTYNPIIHAVMNKSIIKRNIELSKAPLIFTSFTVDSSVRAGSFLDEDDPSELSHFNPDGQMNPNPVSHPESYINALHLKPSGTGGGTLLVLGDVTGNAINQAKNIDVSGSVNITETLTANYFLDYPNTTYRLDPFPADGGTPTRLKALILNGNLAILQTATIGDSFVSTSDFSSDLDLKLTNGSFVSRENSFISSFEDSNDPTYYLIMNDLARLKNLDVSGNFNGDNISSIAPSGILSIEGDTSSLALSVLGTSVFIKRFLDRDDNSFSLDPQSQSTLATLISSNVNVYDLYVSGSATFLDPTTVSNKLTITRTMTIDGFVDFNGNLFIRNSGNTRFELNRFGDILSARSLTLSSGFSLTTSKSLATISKGLSQNSNAGTNILSNTTVEADAFLLSSSLEVSNQAMKLSTPGRLESIGELSLKTHVRAGFGSLNSLAYVSSSSITFTANATSLAFYNLSTGTDTPLNLKLKDLSLSDTLVSSNDLQTPRVQNHQNTFYINPDSMSRFHSLTMKAHATGSGGTLDLNPPLHAKSLKDRHITTLSLNPDSFTTLTRLDYREGTFPEGVFIESRKDKSVFLIRSSTSSEDLLKLKNDLFRLSAKNFMESSGSLDISGHNIIEASDGLFFTTDTGSITKIKLTSEILYDLVGKNLQTADHLHQHSVIKGYNLTDIVRREIDNILSKKNTFSASGLNLYFQPTSASTASLLIQLDASNQKTIELSGDGSLRAVYFAGDGRFLSGVNGADIIDNSLSSHDFKTATIQPGVIANNAITSAKIKRRVIPSSAVLPGAVDYSKIADNTFLKKHFTTSSLQNADFATGAIQGSHLARKSINEDKVKNNVLSVESLKSQAILSTNLKDDAIRSPHFRKDQVRVYHLSKNSIDNHKIASGALIEIDLAPDSISSLEIQSESIDSRVVLTSAITISKIATSSIDHSKIVSRSLIHQDFKTSSITLEKVASLSITSREILDYTLKNEDFMDESITRAKLASDSLRTMHFQTSSILSNQLKTSEVKTRHFALKTIQSSEILDSSIKNEDILSDTLNPSNLATNSIQSIHINTIAITRSKISSGGISFNRFQPFAFITSTISSNAITRANLMDSSIISLHVLNNSLNTVDLKDSSLQGVKIKDYSLLEENLEERTIDTRNLLENAVLTNHFLADSLKSIDVATDTLTTNRIQDGAVKSIHLITETLLSADFKTNAASRLKFATDSLDTSKFISYSLHLSNFALSSVTEGKISSETLLQRSFKTKTLTSADIGDYNILSSKIKTHAVTEEKIETASIKSARFASSIFSKAKIKALTLTNSLFNTASLTTEHILTAAIDSRVVSDLSIEGVDVAINQVSSRLIAPLTITSSSVLPFSLTSRVVDRNQVTDSKFISKSIKTRNISDASITGDLIASDSLNEEALLSYTINQSDIATAQIIYSKLKTDIITSAHIIDASLKTEHFQTSVFLTRHISNDSIASIKIVSQTILGENISSDNLASDQIDDHSIENHHFASRTLTSGKIGANLPASLFAQNSITGGILLDNSIQKEKLISYTFTAYHLVDNSITLSKLKSDSLEAIHLQDRSVTTAKLATLSISNTDLVSYIIESSHVIDGSLKTSDVKTRSLPGSKFITGTIHSNNVSDGNILANHIYDSNVSGDLFQDATLSTTHVALQAISRDLLKNYTISKEKIDESTITSSKFATHFLINESNLNTDSLTSSHFSSYEIRPLHFNKNVITASKMGEVSGSDFMNRTIEQVKIKDDAVTPVKIVSNTFYEENTGFIFVNSTGQIKRTSVDDPSSEDFSVDTNLPVPKRMSILNTSANQFAFSSSTALYIRNTADGASETLLKDFGSKWVSRYGHAIIKHNSKLFLIGGTDGSNFFDDVWSSTDGIIWTEVTASPGFSGRAGFVCLSYGGKIYVIAGDTSTGRVRDVWSSSDGETWAQETAAAAFSPRAYAGGTVYNDGTTKMFLYGGRNGATYYDDVYSSTNGSAWTEITKDLKKEIATETVLWIQSDTTDGSTTFVDRSDSGHTVNPQGSAHHETDASKFGSTSIFFQDSTDSYLKIPDHADFDFTSNKFTMEMWINASAYNGNSGLFGQYVDTNNRWELEVKSDSTISMLAYDSGVITMNHTFNVSSMSTGTWYHVAFNYDGGTYELYLDGVSQGTHTTAALFPDLNASLDIGSTGTGSGVQEFDGYMDEIRISHSPLYTANFTPRSVPYYRRPKRADFQMLTFNDGGGDDIYLMGGRESSIPYLQDVWKSTDAQEWTQLTTVATMWSGRRSFSTTIFNDGGGDAIYLTGGQESGGTLLNDVWKSSNGTNWTEVSASGGFGGNEYAALIPFHDGTATKLYTLGGNLSGGASTQIYETQNGSSWSSVESVVDLVDQEWTATDDFHLITLMDSGSYRSFQFNRSSGATTLLTPMAIEVKSIERKDGSNYLGIDSSDRVRYSTNVNFNFSTIISEGSYDYKIPVFAQTGDAVFVIKEIIPNDERLIKIPWSGGENFGNEEDITPGFTTQSSTFSYLEKASSGQELYFMASIPYSASTSFFKVSTSGSGLTTIAVSNPAGEALILDGAGYNPYIPVNTINADTIKDRSIPVNRIASYTIKPEDFLGGGIDEDSFAPGSLINQNFATGSFSISKWQSRSIPNAKLKTDIFDSSKIKDGSLTTRVFEDLGLLGRAFSNNTFSSAQISSQTIGLDILAQEGFDINKLDTDLASADLALGTLQGRHFSALTSASIENDSISTKKLTLRTVAANHFGKDTLIASDFKLNSMDSSRFMTRQLEGALLEDDSLDFSKILTHSIKRDDIQTGAVLAQNVKTSAIQSGHITHSIFTSSEISNDAVMTRTLRASSITSDLLALDSITESQLNTSSIPSRAIASHTIQTAKIIDSSFTSSHFPNLSITGTASILDSSLRFDQLPFSEVTQGKLDGGVSLDSTRFVKGSLRRGDLSSITGAKIRSSQVFSEHVSSSSLQTAKINNNAITSIKIAPGALRGRHFSDDSIDNGSIAAGKVQDSHITTNTLTVAKFSASSITDAKFADNSIPEAKVEDLSIITANLLDSTVINTKITSFSLLEADFSTGAVHTTHIIDASLTSASFQGASLSSNALELDSFVTSDFANRAVTAGSIFPASIKTQDLKLSGIDNRVIKDDALNHEKIYWVDEYTSLLIHSNSTDGSTEITDASDKQHQIFVFDNTHNETDQKKFFNTSIHFDGTDDYLNVPDSDDFHLGSGNFTIDAWVYDSSGASGNRALIHQEFDGQNKFRVQIKASNVVKVEAKTGNDEKINSTSTASFPAGEWVHLAVVREGSNVKIYFNGVYQESLAMQSDENIGNIAADIRIGIKADLSGEGWDGYIDEFRFSKGIARWTENFIPPDYPYVGITGDKLQADIIATSHLSGGFSSKEIALGVLTDSQIHPEALTSGVVIDSSFNGAKIETGTLSARSLRLKSLVAANFQNQAITESKLSFSIDLSSKVSANANIPTVKIQDGALTPGKVNNPSGNLTTSHFATDAVTDGKLSASAGITGAKFLDDTLTAVKLKTDAISGFENATLSASDFDPTTAVLTEKFARGSLRGDQVALGAITTAKIKAGSTINDSAVISYSLTGADFAANSNVTGDIKNATITQKEIADTEFISSSHFPSGGFSASKFEALSSTQISDGIFTASNFDNNYFDARHLGNITASKFVENAFDSSKIANGTLAQSNFSANVLTDGNIALRELGNSKLATGILTEGNLKTGAIQNAHFQNTSINQADFDSSNTDGLFSGSDVATSNHMHSPITFKREAPTNYTLLQSGQQGRAGFSYRIFSNDTFENARSTCSSDSAQVCDANQLIDICRAGATGTTDFYASSDASHVSTDGEDYFIFPSLKFASNCYEPTTSYVLEYLSPVHVNNSSDTSIRDVAYYDSKYIYQVDNKVYHSTGVFGSGDSVTNGDNSDNARFVWNEYGTNKVVTWDNSQIRSYSAGFDSFVLANNNPWDVSTKSVFDTNSTYYTSVARLDHTKFVVAYRGSGNDGYVRAASIDGTSYTWGGAVEFETGDTNHISVAAFDDTNFVIMYNDASNSNEDTYAVGSVSGETITMCSPQEVDGGTSDIYDLSVTTLSSDTFALWEDYGSSHKPYVKVVQVTNFSSCTYSEGSWLQIGTNRTNLSIDALDSTHLVMVYKDSSDDGYAVVGTVSGGDVTDGTPVRFETSDANYMSVRALTSTKFAVHYSNPDGKVVVCTVASGDVITCGTPVTYNTGDSYYMEDKSIAKLSDTTFAIAYSDSSDSSKGKIKIGEVSGTIVTFDSTYDYTFNSSSSYDISLDSLGTGELVVAFRDSGNNDRGTSRILRRWQDITDLGFWNNDSGALGNGVMTYKDSVNKIALVGSDGDIRWIYEAPSTYSVKAVFPRKYFSVETTYRYNFYVIAYESGSDQTYFLNTAFSNQGAFTAGNSVSVSSGDVFSSFYCSDPGHCFMGLSSGGVYHLSGVNESTANVTVARDTNKLSTEHSGGEDISGLRIVSMDSSTVAGSGSGNRYLYMLATTGAVYRIALEDSAASSATNVKSGATIEKMDDDFIPSGLYKGNDARIRVMNGNNGNILVTSRERHVVSKQDVGTKFACCRSGLH